MIISSFKFCY